LKKKPIEKSQVVEKEMQIIVRKKNQYNKKQNHRINGKILNMIDC
jgi:hypothetical protein